MKQKILVLAIRKFKGDVDSNTYDFTKVTYVKLESNSIDNDKEKGNYSKELAYGNSVEFNNLSKYSYPSVFEANFEMVETRKGYDVNLSELEYVANLNEII